MVRLWLAFGTLLVSVSTWSAVLVLKGGKKLEVASFTKTGNYVIAVQADGKRLSYPVTAVDLQATNEANAVAKEAAAEKTPAEGPKSLFAKAVAKPGSATAAITDADVHKVPPIAEEPGSSEEPAQKPKEEAGVVVLGWSTKQGEEGQWEVITNLVNQNSQPVQDVLVSVRAMGAEGKPLGTGSATYPGVVQPGQAFTTTVRVPSPAEPNNVIFSVTWRQLTPVTEAPTPEQAPKGGAGSEVNTPPPTEEGPGM